MTVDSMAAVKGFDDFYPYGMIMENRSANNGVPDTRYKFTSKERDVETGLDYFGARSYDARIGRWTTIDPMQGNYPGWSGYAYANENPIITRDPNGKWPERIHNQLIEAAFKGDDNDIKNYKIASRWTDDPALGHQTASMSFMHAMRFYKLSEEESADNINNYLNNPFPEVKKVGIDEFGIKLHAIMDMTSPSHEGIQKWGKPTWIFTETGECIEAPDYMAMVGHWGKEQLISTPRFNAAVRLMKLFETDYKNGNKIDIDSYSKSFQQYLHAEENSYWERQRENIGDGR
jgi:RHS repeat-associated protein